MSKSETKTKAVFLATVLVVGMIAAYSPSFIVGAQATEDKYEDDKYKSKDRSYDSYEDDKYKSKDRSYDSYEDDKYKSKDCSYDSYEDDKYKSKDRSYDSYEDDKYKSKDRSYDSYEDDKYKSKDRSYDSYEDDKYKSKDRSYDSYEDDYKMKDRSYDSYGDDYKMKDRSYDSYGKDNYKSMDLIYDSYGKEDYKSMDPIYGKDNYGDKNKKEFKIYQVESDPARVIPSQQAVTVTAQCNSDRDHYISGGFRADIIDPNTPQAFFNQLESNADLESSIQGHVVKFDLSGTSPVTQGTIQASVVCLSTQY